MKGDAENGRPMVERHFLGWNRPLLQLAADWLLERRSDLPRMLVVVPTAQSGRRLREALAEQNVGLAPRVVTPEEFFRVKEIAGIASETEERYAWIEVLRGLKPDEATSLFPVETVERTFGWASGVAKELIHVRAQLTEAGKSFADVIEVSPEAGRWRDLERIERRVLKLLESWQLIDRAAAKRHRATDGSHLLETRRLVIAGVPDPAPLAVTAWRHLAGNGMPVDVLVHAPADEREHFDAWGRPVDEAGAWSKRVTPLAQERIHLVEGAAELGAEVVRLCAGKASDEVSIGLCDAAFASAVETSFEQAGWKAWNPDGRTAGASLLGWLQALVSWSRQPLRWEHPAAVLRHPLTGEMHGGGAWLAAMKFLDGLENDFLPETPQRVAWLTRRTQPGADALAGALRWIDDWRQRLRTEGAGATLSAWAVALLEKGIDDGVDHQWIHGLANLAATIDAMERKGRFQDPADALDLALATLGEARSSAGREDAVVDLNGWLELSYETAPHLVLAGFHEGCVPDGSLDDGFLPDGVRKALGLRDGAARLTRDAFLLHALTNSRHVEVVVAKVDAKSEPKKPSRLLLVDHGASLSLRVRRLFGELGGEKKSLPAWDRGTWKLRFEEEPMCYLDGRPLSPSAIASYLKCPFRFYLERVLKWERYDSGKQELDAMDFGNVCHGALEAMGLDEAMRHTLDAGELKGFLVDRLDEQFAKYETPFTLPLMVQRASAVARLERFAEREIEQRIEGWRTVHVEWKIGTDIAWEIDGQPMKMQIDRIDHHPNHGWRVLDYKTSASAKTPEKAHLASLSQARRRYGDLVVDAKGRSKVWQNLQLPLYAAFVKQHVAQGQPVEAGYVNLPPALQDVGFSIWHGFSDEILDNAMQWTRGVIAALRGKLHWPPVDLTNAEQRYDEFAALAPDGMEQAVDGGMIESLRAIATEFKTEGAAV